MSTYRLPESLSGDIDKFAVLSKGYTDKTVSATEFKAFRVPLGVYEQRKDNVYMARVRATGGVISPAQLLRLIDIAYSHKSNLLHLTTRQEIQIQNLSLDEVEAVLRELQQEGLATKGGGGNTVRNIMVSEFSGISPTETFDTTPYAIELTSLMVAEPDSYLLPRKMKIAFSSDESNIDYAAINDVGLVARIHNGERGFRVYVGGGAGSRPSVGWLLFDFMPATHLYTLVKALKNFFSAHGNRKDRNKARIRFIFYKLGQEETLRLIRSYYDDEIAKGVAHAYEPADDIPAAIVNAMDRGDQKNHNHDASDREGMPLRLWKERYVIRQRQEGYVSVLLPVKLGNISLEDDKTGKSRIESLIKVLRFVATFGDNTLRFTNTQNIRFRNIPEEALPELYALLRDFDDEITTPAVVNNIVSCTGADTCRLGIGLSKGLATAIRKELLRSNLDLDRLSDVSIHVTGCPNSCGQQLWADIGFAGRALRNERAYPGYQVFVAASRKKEPRLAEAIGTISARDIPIFIVRLFDDYLHGDKETDFTAYINGRGRERALRLLDEYKQIPSFEDDKNYYFDWGAEELFTVAPRGKAECSAGLFDMINVDIDTIKDNRKALLASTGISPAERKRLVYSTIYSASRMLLVTRGLDPRSTEELFNLFIKYFIDAGYVDVRYKPLVIKARDISDADLADDAEAAFALADEVEELYKNMDDSLQFKRRAVGDVGRPQGYAPMPPAAPTPPDNSIRKKDLRGVLCPMNFVKTKIELATMQSGELLEILLDDGQPIDNVPGSVKLEGHTITEQIQIDNYWKVVIKKR